MKTFNKFFLISLLILTYSCNKSDDDSNNSQQLTTEDFLTSGKWYLEAKTPGDYTSCEKKGYILFMDNSNFVLVLFDDNSGTCESLGEVNGSYTLINNLDLNLNMGSDSQSAIIVSISEEELTLETEAETLVFDKTEG